MKLSVTLPLFGITLGAFGFFGIQNLILGAVVMWSGVSFLGVGLGYPAFGPKVLMKQKNGTHHPIAILLFAPYFALNWLTLALTIGLTGEAAFNAIQANLYLGRRPLPWEGRRFRGKGFLAVLDVTSEFSRYPHAGQCAYLTLPVLDQTAPPMDDLMRGVRFLINHQDEGNMLVHCALGHGRSALFAACFLLSLDPTATPDDVLDLLLWAYRKSRFCSDLLRLIRQALCSE